MQPTFNTSFVSWKIGLDNFDFHKKTLALRISNETNASDALINILCLYAIKFVTEVLGEVTFCGYLVNSIMFFIYIFCKKFPTTIKMSGSI